MHLTIHSSIHASTGPTIHAPKSCLPLGSGSYSPEQLPVGDPVLAVSVPAMTCLDVAYTTPDKLGCIVT